MIDLETLLSIREDIRVGPPVEGLRLKAILVQMIDATIGGKVAEAIEDVGQQLRGPRKELVFQEDVCGTVQMPFIEPKRLEEA